MTLKDGIREMLGKCREQKMVYPLIVIVASKNGDLVSIRFPDERDDSKMETLVTHGDTKALGERSSHILILDQTGRELDAKFEPKPDASITIQ